MTTLSGNIVTAPRYLFLTRRPMVPMDDVIGFLGGPEPESPVKPVGGFINIRDWFKGLSPEEREKIGWEGLEQGGK